MKIRSATDADLPAIVDIYNSSIPGRMATADLEPVSVDDRRAWFDSHSDRRPIWVMMDADNTVAGWCSLHAFYGRAAYHETVEIAVYIHPDYTRRGYAQALVQHAIDAAPSCGIRTILAFVFAHNAPSLRLLDSLGFDTWGHLPEVAELDSIQRDVKILGRKV